MKFTADELEVLIDGLCALSDHTYPEEFEATRMKLYDKIVDELEVRAIEAHEEQSDPWSL